MARGKSVGRVEETKVVEKPLGVFRTTLSYNDEIMTCHFEMKKGAKIPVHDHAAVQSGYLISGEIKFVNENGESFTATAGTGYTFDSMEKHGAEVVHDSEVVECFAPTRPEYIDE